MSLVGREGEIAHIVHAIEAATRGRATVLVFRGAPGVGKTALLDFAEGLTADFTVLRTSGVNAERGIAYAGLHALLHRESEALEDLPEPARSAMLSALALGPPTMADPLTVGVATLAFLTRKAMARPLAIVIDDFHEVDEASRTALLFALRRLESDSIVGLLAVRDQPTVEMSSLPVLDVAPLESDDVIAMLRHRFELGSSVATALATRSEGNPLTAIELASNLTERQRIGVEPLERSPVVGQAAIELFRPLVESLSPASCFTLQLAALCPVPRVGLVTRAAEAAGVVADLAHIERVRLAERVADNIRFVHPLARSAVLALCGPVELRAAHRALAAVLPDGPEQVWHAAAALDGPDEDVAAALDRLTTTALLQGDPHQAYRSAARAAFVSAAHDTAAPRHLLAAQMAAMGGLPAGQHLDVLFEHGPEHLRPEATVIAAAIAAWHGDSDTLERIIADIDRIATIDAGAAAIVCGFAATERWNHLDLAGGEAVARRGFHLADGELALPRPFGSMPAVAYLVHSSTGTGFAPGDLLDDCTAVTIERAEVDVAFPLALSLIMNGRLEDARSYALEMHQQATGRGAVSAAAWLALVIAMTERRLGWIDSAHRWARRGGELAECIPAGALAISLSKAELAVIAALRGELDESRRLASDARRGAEALPSRPSLEIVDDAEVHCLLAEGRLADAEKLLAQRPQYLGGTAELFPMVYEHVDVLVRLGKPDAATALADHLDARGATSSPGHRGRMARCRGLLADDDAFASCFEAAIEQLGAAALRLEVARTELMFGERLRKTGARVAARTQLERALGEFERAGCRPWAERALTALRATGLRRSERPTADREPLTAMEEQIAHAVAAGRSNREVAAELFVSTKTVEAHLTRAYRKLGVRSRTELSALIHTERPPR